MKTKVKWFGIIVLGLLLVGLPPLYAGNLESSPADVEYEMAVQDRVADLEEIAANRDAVMDEIVGTWSADANGWEEQFDINVSMADDSKLLALRNAESFDEVISILDPENLGATSVYVPVTPCKIVDTRSGGGGFIAANATRSYNTYGNLTSQGGSICNSPFGEPTAAVLSVVAITPNGQGNVKIKPYLNTLNAGHSINFAPIGTNLANTGTVPINRFSTFDIYVVTQNAGCDVSIQVLGYYYPIDENELKVKFAGDQSGSTTNLTTAGGCTNYANSQVSIFAPGPGKITVTAQAWMRLTSHTFNIGDQVTVYIGTASNDCTFSNSSEGYNAMSWLVPQTFGSFSSTWFQPISVSRTFTVTSGGTRTYYLNGIRNSGSGTMGFWFAGMQATYYPNF